MKIDPQVLSSVWSSGWVLCATLLATFVGGYIIAWLIARSRLEVARARLEERSRALEQAAEGRDAALADAKGLAERTAALRTALDAERRQSAISLRLMGEAREQLAIQFRALASEVLDEKSRAVSDRHSEQLGQLLEPLQQRLAEFRGRVDEVYEREGKDRAALAEQVRHLMTLNQQLSQDALDLTRALKGQNKAQGTWGELILERVLVAAGLRRGHEFDMQVSMSDREGHRLQPDAVIRMPEDRVLVVDAKLSLVAWEAHVNADDEEARSEAMRRHVASMRRHLRGLAERRYENLHGASSPDFVVMFVPIEAAFSAAVGHDESLWQEAWQRNVLIVGPASLMFVLRIVSQLWRQLQQDRNAQEIAACGADLYDRFVGFVADIEKLGDRLRQARESWEQAHTRLATGRGNLVKRAEQLRDLGVKPSKALCREAVERARADESE